MPSWRFRKEYEIDFTAQAGQPVFESEALNAQSRNLRNPIARMDLDESGKLVKRERGRLAIYQDVRESWRYAVGMDVSEGVAQSDSTIEVFEAFKREQAAELADNRISPPELGRFAAAVGEYYNRALICCVRPMHGITVLRTLVDDCHYTNLWHDRMDEHLAAMPTERLGWAKGEGRSPRLMDPYIEAVDAQEVILRSMQCRDQHGQYIYDEKGLATLSKNTELNTALRARHGDMVVGCALAYRACCDVPKARSGHSAPRQRSTDQIGMPANDPLLRKLNKRAQRTSR
jgi:hypothetical protein